jgi:hypothetical protein
MTASVKVVVILSHVLRRLPWMDDRHHASRSRQEPTRRHSISNAAMFDFRFDDFTS